MDRKKFIGTIKLLKTSVVLNIWAMLVASVGMVIFTIILFKSIAIGGAAVILIASVGIIITAIMCLAIYLIMFSKIFKGINQVLYLYDGFIKAKQAVTAYLVFTVINVALIAVGSVNIMFQFPILETGISAIMIVTLFMMYYYIIKAINEVLLNEGDTEVSQNGLSAINFYKIAIVVSVAALFFVSFYFSAEITLLGIFLTFVSVILMQIVLFSIVKYFTRVIEFFEAMDYKKTSIQDFRNLSHGMQDDKL